MGLALHVAGRWGVNLFVRCALAFLVMAAACQAGEYAVLGTGFRIRAESHTVVNGVVRLETGQGEIDIPAASVASFEREEYTPPAVQPSKPALPVLAPPITPDPSRLIAIAALDAGIPPALVESVARAESGFAVNAVSPKGAIGLMQLMPATAAALNADAHDPLQNAEAGAKYLADLLRKYEEDPHQVTKALAAYNAGPGAVDKYHGIPPYRETVDYVNRVVKQYLKDRGKDRSAPPR